MKKILYIIPFLLCFGNAFAQNTPEFSFKLYFEDAIGNKDTLIIGNDSLATVGIDTTFGEKNIITQPWNSNFDVRLSNEYWLKEGNGLLFPDTIRFQTKKQIINKNLSNVNTNIEIDMKVKGQNWPVTISWDSTLFNGQGDTSQYVGSGIFTIEYGMWFDGGTHPVYFRNKGHMIVSNSWMPNNHLISSYYHAGNDTIYTLWFLFADSSIYTAGIENEKKNINKIGLYPNPFKNKFFIGQLGSQQIQNITITNLLGKKQRFIRIKNRIIMPDAQRGMYLIHIQMSNEKEEIIKIIKK